jgi:hypothetical protein
MKRLSYLSDRLELWLVWLIVTGICWSAGLAIALIVAKGASLALSAEVSWVIGGVAVGVLTGLVQWQILHPEVKGGGWWTLATAIGWVAGLVVTAFVVRVTDWTLGGLIGAALGGLVFGLVQLLALRPGISGKGAWVAGTTAGWTGALALGIALTEGNGPDTLTAHTMQVVASGALGWVIIGLTATLALVYLFPKPHRKDIAVYDRWFL